MNRRSSDSNYLSPALQPKRRSRFWGCLWRIFGVFLIAGGIYFVLTYKTSGRAADLVPAISTFTGEPNMIIKQTGVEQASYGSVKRYSGNLANGDQAYFDIDDNGAVTSFLRAKQPNGEVRVSKEQARETALDFAATHYRDLSWMDTAQINENLTGTDGSSNRFYTFQWVSQDPRSGATLPQMLKIEVNAQTGQVDRTLMVNEPVTISTIPSINKQTAIQTALSALPKTPKFEVVEVSLTVATVPLYEPNGKQALIWTVTVTAKPDKTGYVAGATVFIDAQTGEVLLVDPFA
jgi:hypothetical protein